MLQLVDRQRANAPISLGVNQMLSELSLAQLNVAYNRAVAELALPLKEIKGFKDKPSGVARLTKVMADHNLVLDGTKLVKANGADTTEPDGLAGLNADMAGLNAALTPAAEPTNVVAFKKPVKAAPAPKAAKPAPKAKVGKPVVVATKRVPLNKRGPQAQFADHQVITLLVANPKKPGSMAFRRYKLYVDGMTVREALDAGLRRDDFRWDTAKGHISIK